MTEADLLRQTDNEKKDDLTYPNNNAAVDIKIITAKDIGTDYNFKREIVWKNAFGFLFLHTFAVFGVISLFSGKMMWQTLLWCILVAVASSEGVTIGAHRLYAHKSFSAHPILRMILIILQTIAGQNCMYIWVRDHRLHHRYSDTDGDPHNSKRGFFFCHIGWLMSKKHPLVKLLGPKIDMSDLEADWMVMFQKKHYKTLYLIFAFFIPIIVPIYFFGENWLIATLAYFLRYVLQLNGTWLVNSAAHLYGTRPYDKNLQPVENWFVSMISLGEGWHNYHHAFPWDYKAAELTMHFNQSASLIRFFEKIGLAHDLKTATPDMVVNRIQRVGDRTHYDLGTDEARSAVAVKLGPLHPLNPTYNTTQDAPPNILKTKGLPLFHENDVLKDVESTLRQRNIAA